jgi:organic hydroperoxide reductase OsmC/OhrA
MSDQRSHPVTLTLTKGYEFVAEFPELPVRATIVFDEPPPLGSDRGPSAAAVLGAAVANCLSASLAFCLRKSRVTVEGLTTHAVTHIARNEEGKFRISGIDVELAPEVADDDAGKLDRCESLFEEFCIVTESVRNGIPVNVTVRQQPRERNLLAAD